MATNIQIKAPVVRDFAQIKPTAFMDILMHVHRFWGKDNPDSKFAYGILIGKFEKRTRVITEAIPILHHDRADLVFDETFYKHWDDLDKLKDELDSQEKCIGWYKVIERDMKFRATDIRNQVKIQSLYRGNIALLLDPNAFLDNQDYGFSIYHLLKSGDHYHEMCDDAKIAWEILELGNDVDKTVNQVIDMINKYPTEKPFIEEIDEFEMPEITPDDGDDDAGGYVTPEFDPNAPVYY